MWTTWRRLGSSFQNAQWTSPKIFRRMSVSACSNVGALESGLTVEPWPTTIKALSGFDIMLDAVGNSRRAPKSNGFADGWCPSAQLMLVILSGATVPRMRDGRAVEGPRESRFE